VDDIFRSYILPALIGSGSAILIGFLELVIFWRSNKSEKDRLETQLKNEIEINKRNNSIQYITDKRVDWINKLRENSAEYVSLVIDVTGSFKTGMITKEMIIELYKRENTLKLLMNFNGDIDSLIIKKIHKIGKYISEEKYDQAKLNVYLILIHLQIYLKLEWNRVNNEVKTGIYSNEQLRREMVNLYTKYPYTDELEKKEIEYACLSFEKKWGHDVYQKIRNEINQQL
jgi:hypothetical protein